jgi:DNA-directed RNA polymerase specialized sigma24 family protein
MYIPADSQVIGNLATVGGATSAERQAEALGGALEVFRSYLTLIARRELAPDLAAKVGASDLVQETFLAAGRDIARLRGRSPAELRSWLEGILQHLLANTRRRYRGTRKRRVDLEVPGCGGAGGAVGSGGYHLRVSDLAQRPRDETRAGGLTVRRATAPPRALPASHRMAPSGGAAIPGDRRAAGHLA